MSKIKHLLTSKITFAEVLRLSGAGDPDIGALCNTPARVEDELGTRIGTEGNEQLTKHKIVTEIEIPLSAFVWLPDANTNKLSEAKRVVSTKSAATPNGFRVYETWL